MCIAFLYGPTTGNSYYYHELLIMVSNGTDIFDYCIGGYYNAYIQSGVDGRYKTGIYSNRDYGGGYIKNTDILSGLGTLDGQTYYNTDPGLAIYFV